MKLGGEIWEARLTRMKQLATCLHVPAKVREIDDIWDRAERMKREGIPEFTHDEINAVAELAGTCAHQYKGLRDKRFKFAYELLNLCLFTLRVVERGGLEIYIHRTGGPMDDEALELHYDRLAIQAVFRAIGR
jgi:hypothetical protein